MLKVKTGDMFWKRKNKGSEHPLHDKAAKGIAGFILKIQNGFAAYCGKLTAGFGKRSKLIFLFLVILVFGGLSLQPVIRVFSDSSTDAKKLMPAPIRIPQYDDGEMEGVPETDLSVSDEVFEKIKVFRGYMDSLQQSGPGKFIYDSILQARPGLMDSAQMLEQIYLQQQKK